MSYVGMLLCHCSFRDVRVQRWPYRKFHALQQRRQLLQMQLQRLQSQMDGGDSDTRVLEMIRRDIAQVDDMIADVRTNSQSAHIRTASGDAIVAESGGEDTVEEAQSRTTIRGRSRSRGRKLSDAHECDGPQGISKTSRSKSRSPSRDGRKRSPSPRHGTWKSHRTQESDEVAGVEIRRRTNSAPPEYATTMAAAPEDMGAYAAHMHNPYYHQRSSSSPLLNAPPASFVSGNLPTYTQDHCQPKGGALPRLPSFKELLQQKQLQRGMPRLSSIPRLWVTQAEEEEESLLRGNSSRRLHHDHTHQHSSSPYFQPTSQSFQRELQQVQQPPPLVQQPHQQQRTTDPSIRLTRSAPTSPREATSDPLKDQKGPSRGSLSYKLRLEYILN